MGFSSPYQRNDIIIGLLKFVHCFELVSQVSYVVHGSLVEIYFLTNEKVKQVNI